MNQLIAFYPRCQPERVSEDLGKVHTSVSGAK